MSVAKPRLFIGSSVENLDVAYAAQEALEFEAEVTVWSQGIFALSRTTMESLMDALDEADFALFVMSPDDITHIRDQKKQTVRDNVVFELGLFIGRLGRERVFMLVPRGSEENHLPTDLLGITPASYEPERQDGNLTAAIGPGCNRVRKAINVLGGKRAVPLSDAQSIGQAVVDEPDGVVEGKEDILALIEGWMGARPSSENTKAIKFRDVDRELGLKSGSAKQYIAEAATRYNYVPARSGEEVIIFRREEPRRRVRTMDF